MRHDHDPFTEKYFILPRQSALRRSTSSADNWNIKSEGNLFLLRMTCSLSRFVGTQRLPLRVSMGGGASVRDRRDERDGHAGPDLNSSPHPSSARRLVWFPLRASNDREAGMVGLVLLVYLVCLVV
jgi:hypothetical protein